MFDQLQGHEHFRHGNQYVAFNFSRATQIGQFVAHVETFMNVPLYLLLNLCDLFFHI